MPPATATAIPQRSAYDLDEIERKPSAWWTPASALAIDCAAASSKV